MACGSCPTGRGGSCPPGALGATVNAGAVSCPGVVGGNPPPFTRTVYLRLTLPKGQVYLVEGAPPAAPGLPEEDRCWRLLIRLVGEPGARCTVVEGTFSVPPSWDMRHRHEPLDCCRGCPPSATASLHAYREDDVAVSLSVLVGGVPLLAAASDAAFEAFTGADDIPCGALLVRGPDLVLTPPLANLPCISSNPVLNAEALGFYPTLESMKISERLRNTKSNRAAQLALMGSLTIPNTAAAYGIRAQQALLPRDLR